MKAIVTGASGFVGRHLIEHLETCGDEVIGLDRHAGEGGASRAVDLLDGDAVIDVIRSEAPDAIYHLGGWSDVGASWNHPREAYRVNTEGTLNVLLAAQGLIARVLVVSSADVYGKVSLSELPLTEDSALRPVTPYAASKIGADFLALQAWLGRRVEALRRHRPGQRPAL